MYTVETTKCARKYLDALDAITRNRLVEAIREMSSDPFSGDVKKLSGHHLLYRKRVGNFRILFEVYERRLFVVIVDVASRGEVYKRL